MQDWVTNTSGHRGRTKLKRACSSGCQPAVLWRSRTGTRENPTTSGTRTEKKSTVWNCGTAMGKDSSGTTRPVRLRHSSCAKCRDFCVKIWMENALLSAAWLQAISQQSVQILATFSEAFISRQEHKSEKSFAGVLIGRFWKLAFSCIEKLHWGYLERGGVENYFTIAGSYFKFLRIIVLGFFF